MKRIVYEPIGVIHSPFKDAHSMPIQSAAALGVRGTVEVFPEYTKGLDDIEGFSHIILIYHFHLSKRFSLKVKPYLDDKLHGVFATRAPARPNPIGQSVVRLLKVGRETLHIQGVDIVEGTPLLDVKPYVPQFDAWNVQRIGWLENNVQRLFSTRDDGRFT
jgi:tRNA-Thr(GGU) m(6)t(6)A37 methyltransferase TsaA